MEKLLQNKKLLIAAAVAALFFGFVGRGIYGIVSILLVVASFVLSMNGKVYAAIACAAGSLLSGIPMGAFLPQIVLLVFLLYGYKKSNFYPLLGWIAVIIPAVVQIFWMVDSGSWSMAYLLLEIIGAIVPGLVYKFGFEDTNHTSLREYLNSGNTSEGQEKERFTSFDSAYCDMGKHILLLFLTFGVWYYIWIYRMTGYLNAVEDEEYRDPTKKLLLCIFVPFYAVYWIYKSAQRVDKLAAQKGVASELSTLCLVLALFVGVVPPILIQDKVNAIITHKPVATKPNTEATVGAQPVDAAVSEFEKLEKLTKLYEQGILTDEEYKQKKADLLAKM